MNVLIAFYSRTGNTRCVADLVADRLRSAGCQVTVEQIMDRKSRAGIGGWLGGVKDSLLKRATEIEPLQADVGAFDLVAVGTPIWAGTMAPAVKAFLSAGGERIRRAAFFCTSGGSSGDKTFVAMAAAAGCEPVATEQIRDRHVKQAHPDEFRAKAKQFAAALAGTPTAPDEPA